MGDRGKDGQGGQLGGGTGGNSNNSDGSKTPNLLTFVLPFSDTFISMVSFHALSSTAQNGPESSRSTDGKAEHPGMK